MKERSSLFAAALLLAGTVGLLIRGGSLITEQRQQRLGQMMLEEQLGTAAAVELSGETGKTQSGTEESETNARTLSAGKTGSGAKAPEEEMVPVTVVEEAWEENEEEAISSGPPETEENETLAQKTSVTDIDLFPELRNETDYEIDFKALPDLPEGLCFSDKPCILLMHTHGTESYTEPDTEEYHSLDPEKSVLAVAEAIAGRLEERGYGVIHDETICDYPEFTGAYNRSRAVVERWLEQEPGIVLVLDIHRDSVEDDNGDQVGLSCDLSGAQAAQMMLVVGTNAGGLEHDTWRQNLTLATLLQGCLMAENEELMRPVNLRTERFNQDLTPMNLLLEVGTSGNTLEEAVRSGEVFGEKLADVLDWYSSHYT